jgi:glycosyltransferase involved in cell wall biosynthesis
MKISIVTISFNQKFFLEACIESILGQKDCELEYIVVDPGSTDGSRQLIESYGDSIIKVFEPDEGPADGLNKGFARASGHIYGFINSDDYLLPGALSLVSKFFQSNPSNCFVTGHGFTETASGKQTRIHPSVLSPQSMLHRSAVIFQQGTFFPSFLFKLTGGFNKFNDTCWDFELYLELLNQGAVHHVLEKDLAVFRLHQDSISGSGRLEEKYFDELDALFLKHVGRSRNFYDKAKTIYMRLMRQSLRFQWRNERS